MTSVYEKKFNDLLWFLGDGSFSQVYKVKRISDGEEYALKKVSVKFHGRIWDADSYFLKKAILNWVE